MADLDAAYARAGELLDPALLDLITDRIEATVAGTRPRCEAADERDRAVCAVIDQELVDVAGLDDAAVRRASSFFPEGGLADVVMAAYVIEARTRLRLASERLWGELP